MEETVGVLVAAKVVHVQKHAAQEGTAAEKECTGARKINVLQPWLPSLPITTTPVFKPKKV